VRRSTALAATAGALALLSATPAMAQVFTGDTTGSPTFESPDENGTNPPLSVSDGDFPYDVLAFNVTISGTYSLLLESSAFDTYLGLYSGSFDRSAPLLNALIYNDDDGGDGNSLINYSLDTGTSYFAVVTGFFESDFGPYTLTIRGPGSAVVTEAVPEPATWAMMLLGFGAVGLAFRRGRTRQIVSATV
jgi:hypothetical protein